MSRLLLFFMVIVAGFLAVILIASWNDARASDRIDLSWSAVSDGACTDTTHTVQTEWTHRSKGLDVDARVRTAPSAADCRTESLTYDVSTERRFPLLRGVEAMARFGASQHAVSAPYAVSEGGRIKRRSDGKPAHVVTLPAGSVNSLEATLGASWRPLPWLRAASGVNLAPVEWADGSEGRTLHVGLYADGGPLRILHGDLSAAITAEIGDDAYGTVKIEWRRPLTGAWSFRLAAFHDWGLDALASDAPAAQTFAGLPMTLTGDPQASATTLTAGIGMEF